MAIGLLLFIYMSFINICITNMPYFVLRKGPFVIFISTVVFLNDSQELLY